MKKNLLLLLPLLCSFTAATALQPAPKRVVMHNVTSKSVKAPALKAVKTLNPMLAAEDGSATLFESFESYDKTFPEGWTLNLTNENDWMIYAPGMLGIPTTDGAFAAMATCLTGNDGKQQLHDESWLVSPEFTPKANEQLQFDLYFDVRSLYVWTTSGDDKNIDEEDGLILNRENAENMKICISVDGGEWVVLKDLWEDYGKLGYWDIIYDYEMPEFHKFSFSMDEYVGKNVKIGFCHSYFDGRSGYGMFLDAVRVSLPPIDASYSLPFGTLFWGMSDDLQAMPSWALAPYYTDLTWINETYAEGANSTWEYTAFNSGDVESTSENDLTTNYKPDYSNDPEARYTMFSFPTLSVSAPGASAGEYTYANGEGYVFAGISAELPTRDGGMLPFGLSTFDQSDDVQIYNADFDVPAWGHNGMTNEWWTNHYFDGDQREGDYAKVTANMNFFYTNGAPVVIEGVRVAAVAVCDDDAEFVMDIVALKDDFTIGDVLASATLLGKDLLRIDDAYANFPNSVMMGFKFDKPVVVDGVNFIARLSGFNSDKVSYYAPLQSYKSAPLCYGFSVVEIAAPSLDRPVPGETMMPTAVFEELYNSFAFYLDAYYPYLQGEESEYEFKPGETEKTFVFDSSYPADKLTVADSEGKLPEWLTVEKSGSFGTTAIKVVSQACEENPATAVLEISAPGVRHSLTLRQAVSTGVEGVTSNSPVVETSLFNLLGRRIDNEPVAGAYIVRKTHADGTVTVEKLMK